MTSTASVLARPLLARLDRHAVPHHRSPRAGFRRLASRLRLHLILWRVRAELAKLPGFVLRDIDIDRAVHSAARVLARRRRMGERPWTS